MNMKLTAIAAMLLVLGLGACERQGPAEKAGESVDEAVQNAGDAVENAGDKVKDKTHYAFDRI